ncbi:hypothetical protein G6F50_018166 [Rhizopus delemar]|uniref:Uncharacterized protein n=1 Tax=Rhizopus delemar TaxID=936053 RepID=A0A9P6XN88_9FUNG|nr:hypothetical protein G6F50_018166 [Rhizopus delemar]
MAVPVLLHLPNAACPVQTLRRLAATRRARHRAPGGACGLRLARQVPPPAPGQRGPGRLPWRGVRPPGRGRDRRHDPGEPPGLVQE